MNSPRPPASRYLDSPRPLAFAHRGGAYHPEIEGLENTLAAFRHAVDLGYVYLETDVHVTSDGVLLAFHDTVLDRVTDRTGNIAESTYAEVQQALIGGSEPVPTLAAAVRRLPRRPASTSTSSPRGPSRRWRPSSRSATPGTGCWSARSRGAGCEAFRRRTQGRVATSAHPLEVAVFLLSPSARLTRLLTRGPSGGAAGPAPARTRSRWPRGGSYAVRTPLGVQVHVWTIDDPIEMNTLLDRGVDGIMTDRTDILRDVLRTRGQWNGPEEDA